MTLPPNTENTGHIPVMLTEVLASLQPADGEVYVDATFGGGSYSKAILDAASCRVIGLDRDPAAIQRGQALKEAYPNRLDILEGPFSQIAELLESIGQSAVDGIIFDLGVSSFQFDEADRGFSFRFEGPLDMRMSGQGQSAADVVNSFDAEDLAEVIYKYGEERHSRAIARAIVGKRQRQPITTTKALADLITSVIYRKPKAIHPATKTFQALRIYVNDELRELHRALEQCLGLLRVGGRLVVVSFHSLEDRLVKNYLREQREMLDKVYLKAMTAKPLVPSEGETRENPRSRSAKLRGAVKSLVGEGRS